MAKTNFWESAYRNQGTFNQYFNRLVELSVAMFDWKNLPEGIDTRFMELVLFSEGKAVFFYDDDMDEYLALRCTINGRLNVYQIPIKRRAYASNGYQKRLDNTNSVIIYNNYLHTNSILDVEMFARRLMELDRTIDVNARAQKTPVLIQGDESQKLSLKNLYKEFDGNSPVIYCDSKLNKDALTVLRTDAPYVADKLYELKTQIWNEALTYLGIPNLNLQKKERLVTDEVERHQGGTIASRMSRLESRRQACRQINKMFGLNISCDFREDTSDESAEKKDGEKDE